MDSVEAGIGERRQAGILLCHKFCDLGAVALASVLADPRLFLVANPEEAVVVVNEREGVSPTDIERAFTQAGLLEFVCRGPLGPFSRLRAMIDSSQRLVVMAENDAGSIHWYHLASAHELEETPFRFSEALRSRSSASCRPNRGPNPAPLFLLNHWVDTSRCRGRHAPRPSTLARRSSGVCRRVNEPRPPA